MAIADAILGKVFHRRRCRTDQDVCTNGTPAAAKDLPLARDESRSRLKQPQRWQDGLENNGTLESQRTYSAAGLEGSISGLSRLNPGRDAPIVSCQHRYGSRSLSAQVAAVKSLFPDRQVTLYQRSVSQDLQNLKPFESTKGRVPNGESTSNQRFLNQRSQTVQTDAQAQLSRERWATLRPTKRHHSGTEPALGRSTDTQLLNPSNIPETRVPISQDTILRRGVHPDSSANGDAPGLQGTTKRTSVDVRAHTICSPILAYEERRCTLSRKPEICDLRNASELGHIRRHSMQTPDVKSKPTDMRRSPITRSHLDKPLPPIPQEAGNGIERVCRSSEDGNRLDCPPLPQLQHSQDAPEPGNYEPKVDTTFYKQWSPSVTHETITRRVHEVREEHITREVHNHHVYHRTLPIIDVELLPARHFIPAEDGYLEISEGDIPAEIRPSEDWVRSEIVSKLLVDNEGNDLSEVSHDESNNATDNDVKENLAAVGVNRAESQCVHPSILNPCLVDTERTYAVPLNV